MVFYPLRGVMLIGGPLIINGKDILVNNDTPVGTLLATFSLGLI
ncbi:hypothetical protein [Arsenophonus endosymbiont of Aleurodicus floccissimus]|nr:hypothetical protein [Arsenophonus endosymbiont of Aleurodicus floccissimus]